MPSPSQTIEETHLAAQLKDLPTGSQVRLTGWVYTKRVHGSLVFITLRDSSGLVQVAIKKGQIPAEEFTASAEVPIESSITVEGTIVQDPRAPDGLELRANRFKVIGASIGDFPIKATSGKEFLLDMRHLHLRSPRTTAILRVRSRFCEAAREWFWSHQFYEIQCPTFVTASVEGGATLFETKYFNRKVYLTQSVQFYQEAGITSLQKVFSMQPSFRAEKSRTLRHLTEFWQMEAEIANGDLEEIMRVQESLLQHCTQEVAEKSASDLKFLKRRFRAPTEPFKRVTYSECVELLQSKGMKVEWGDDFGMDEERVLSKEFQDPFFVTYYPRKAKAFYHMPNPNDPKVTLSADLLAPSGIGEISGSGQRIHDYNQLVESIKEFDLNPTDYEWYLDLRRYGTVPHSGFGMGIDRTLRWILAVNHIRDVTLFPRTLTRVYP
jgi:asparaginyl-tRNA synthetase